MIVSLFAIFPKEFVMAIAGLAMFSTVGTSLSTAVLHESDREASMITFFVTASGFTILGVGAAFWGLVAGGLTSLVLKKAG